MLLLAYLIDILHNVQCNAVTEESFRIMLEIVHVARGPLVEIASSTVVKCLHVLRTQKSFPYTWYITID